MRRLHRPPAEHERGRKVNNIRRVIGKDSLDPVHTAQRHPHVRVAGQRHRRKPVHERPVHHIQDLRVLGGRGDHHNVIAPLLQVLKHPKDGVRNPVHQWQE
ncbi:hypothetical protein D9M71_772060 [compost metagenome]